MKVRVVHGRRGWTVHGLHCSQLGKGDVYDAEAPSAIEVADVLEEDVDIRALRFAPCVAFGDPSNATPPRISRRDTLDVKVDAVSSWAEENGWTVDDMGQTILLVREHSEATETIRLMFKGNSYDRAQSSYSYQNSIEPMQDLDAVLWRIAAKPGAVPDAASRRTRPLPFGQQDEDVEILDKVFGKTIKWINSISGTVESARLPIPKPGGSNFVKIDTTAAGRRVLSFLDTNGTGFRAAALEAIMEVSG